jgi:hypothetical protein
VGVFTFYPGPEAPDDPRQEQMDDLFKEQDRLLQKSDGGQVSEADQRRLDEIRDEIDAVNEELNDERTVWARNTSIVLIVFATVLMVVSLVLPEPMTVISNGTLLGGLFTMVYGTGWSFAGDDSRARFVVVSAALVLTLVFGYVKFVRPHQVALGEEASGESG